LISTISNSYIFVFIFIPIYFISSIAFLTYIFYHRAVQQNNLIDKFYTPFDRLEQITYS